MNQFWSELRDFLFYLYPLLNNPLSKKIAGKYLDKALECYRKGDYISALYYARYGIIKAPVNLETPFRILLAMGIVAAGIFFGRKKEEELI